MATTRIYVVAMLGKTCQGFDCDLNVTDAVFINTIKGKLSTGISSFSTVILSGSDNGSHPALSQNISLYSEKDALYFDKLHWHHDTCVLLLIKKENVVCTLSIYNISTCRNYQIKVKSFFKYEKGFQLCCKDKMIIVSEIYFFYNTFFYRFSVILYENLLEIAEKAKISQHDNTLKTYLA